MGRKIGDSGSDLTKARLTRFTGVGAGFGQGWDQTSESGVDGVQMFVDNTRHNEVIVQNNLRAMMFDSTATATAGTGMHKRMRGHAGKSSPLFHSHNLTHHPITSGNTPRMSIDMLVTYGFVGLGPDRGLQLKPYSSSNDNGQFRATHVTFYFHSELYYIATGVHLKHGLSNNFRASNMM